MTTLREAAQQALEAMDHLHRTGDTQVFDLCHRETTEALRAALTEPVQEPVAWYSEARHIDSAWAAAVTMKHPGPEGKYVRKVTPLYTAPPQRKPLTQEQLYTLYDEHATHQEEGPAMSGWFDFARAIERAHGIE